MKRKTILQMRGRPGPGAAGVAAAVGLLDGKMVDEEIKERQRFHSIS